MPDRDRNFELTFINRTCLWNGKEQHKRGDGYMAWAGGNDWKKGLVKSPNMVARRV